MCLGWSSLWTDLWFLLALVFVLENGGSGGQPCDESTSCKSLEDVYDYVFKLVTSGEATFCWLSCKLQEADSYPVTHSPNEEAVGIYSITLVLLNVWEFIKIEPRVASAADNSCFFLLLRLPWELFYCPLIFTTQFKF